MTDDRWRRVIALFEAAQGRAPGERSAFLAEACGGDEDLRAEVESLLAHHAKAPPDFLRPDEDDERDSDVEPDPLIGQRIGHYQIQRVIAVGGMGTVYEAVQDQPHRPVALKVMKPGMYSRQAMRRFRVESEILGHLQHPNIAQVYEAGMHNDRGPLTGVPYFAMEYMPDARTIVQYAREDGLELRDRLRLLATVCEAVHHGHLKGIVHRDLKPANILVDRAGQVKIIDFGVARSTDSDVTITTMQTGLGQLVGTVQYMSPEQCAADPRQIDARSDVYSLGVVLYELLCGRLPYDVAGTGIHTAARRICEDDPIRPGSVDRRLRGDVEVILLTALEKNPEKRYQSAADLAQDIRRFLNREPIEARPPGPWTKGVRWVTRHPVMVTGMTCLLLACGMLGGAYLMVWLAHDRPYDVRLTEDRDEVQLVSYNGNVLDRITTNRPGQIAPDHLTLWRARSSDRSLAILGFGALFDGAWAGDLCAFDIGDGYFGDPLWCRGIEPRDVPTTDRAGFSCTDFGPREIWTADVFPGNAGLEIIHDFAHKFSRRALRIVSLDGEILYQVWHDGAIWSVYWMDRAKLLVVMGEDATEYWEYRCAPGIEQRYPIVLFALRPKAGFRSNEYLRREVEDTVVLSAVWYRCLLPPAATDTLFRFRLQRPGLAAYDDGAHVQLVMHYRQSPDVGIDVFVNADGDLVATMKGDSYNRRNPDLPPIEEFHLGDLPPAKCKDDKGEAVAEGTPGRP